MLYSLADNCDYGEFKDQMIRDRLVVGIRDNSLSERLQMDAELTLEKAMKTIRQREAVHEQQMVLSGGERTNEPGNLDEVNHKKQNSRHSRPTRPTSSKLCGRCGKGPHGRDKCPAREAVCHRCKKKGHYNSQCHTKMGANQHSVETSIDTAFLDVMTGTKQSSWTANISLNSHPIQFKLDTGAEVTAISDKVFSSLCNAKLQKASKVLLGPA